MGQPARLTAWLMRIAFLALIAAAGVVRVGGAAQSGQDGLLAPAHAVLEAAGYRVDPVRRRFFLNGKIPADRFLVGRHAGCRADVTVQPMRIADRPAPPAGGQAPGPLFVFGGWTGARQSRVRILLEAVRLQALSVIRLGRGVRPIPALLVVTDPSACLALAPPDWERVWVD